MYDASILERISIMTYRDNIVLTLGYFRIIGFFFGNWVCRVTPQFKILKLQIGRFAFSRIGLFFTTLDIFVIPFKNFKSTNSAIHLPLNSSIPIFQIYANFRLLLILFNSVQADSSFVVLLSRIQYALIPIDNQKIF